MGRDKERRTERSSIQFCFLLLQKVLLYYCDGDFGMTKHLKWGWKFLSIMRPIVRPLGFIPELNEFVSWSETKRDNGEWREAREGGRRKDYGRWREKGNRSGSVWTKVAGIRIHKWRDLLDSLTLFTQRHTKEQTAVLRIRIKIPQAFFYFRKQRLYPAPSYCQNTTY